MGLWAVDIRGPLRLKLTRQNYRWRHRTPRQNPSRLSFWSAVKTPSTSAPPSPPPISTSFSPPPKRSDLSHTVAMVEALCPARFYGGSLPRPRFLSDDARVDPPPPVMDPLLAWAADAHWSMGGLSFDRKRLVGKIDGRVERIRAHKEQMEKAAAKARKHALVDESEEEDGDATPPPVRLTRKRAARAGEDGVEKEARVEASGESGRGGKRRLVKKADVGGEAGEALVEASTTPSPRRSPRTKKIESSQDAAVEEIGGKKSPRSGKLIRKIKT